MDAKQEIAHLDGLDVDESEDQLLVLVDHQLWLKLQHGQSTQYDYGNNLQI